MEGGLSSKSARAPRVIPSSGPSGMTRARPSRKPTTSQGIFLLFPIAYAALAAQADGPLRPRHFHRQPLDTGDPAKAGQGGNGLNILEQSAHQNPFKEALFAPPGQFFRRFFRPSEAHLEAKNLNGGKLNKSNQGHGRALRTLSWP